MANLLPPEYYKDALKSEPVAAAPAPTPAAPSTFGTAPAPVNPQQPFATPTSEIVKKAAAPGIPIADQLASFYKPIHLTAELTPEEQTAKFGGPVGSAEYYAHKSSGINPYIDYLPKQVLSSIGVMFPDEQTWDKMSNTDKVVNLAQGEAYGLGRMILSLPRAVAQTAVRFGVSMIKPFEKNPDEITNLPYVGSVPTYYQTFDEARKSGMGPLAATLYTGGLGLGDATLIGSVMEAPLRAAFQPRAAVTTPVGEATIQNIAPIKQALIRDSGVVKGVAKAQSSNEYYTLPESVAKQFGGSKNNTYFKVTPASPDSVEISVVQTRAGAVQRAVDWTKSTIGFPDKRYAGDFGPEVKQVSQIVKVGENSPLLQGALKEGEGVKVGATPSAPLKGMEFAPVTTGDLANIVEIAKANGIAPGIRDAVVRTVSGKSVMGEMTQTEYVKAAQTLLRFSESGKYTQDLPWLNPAAQYISPQRYWMRNYEESSGIPLYSEVYTPMEEGFRARNVFEATWKGKAREVYGKYAGGGFGEQRRLINAYMQGDSAAIMQNSTLDAAMKSDLVAIAEKMRGMYNDVGPLLDVPAEIFLKDYQPHVQDIGGIHQLYKPGAEIPGNLDFFAKFKRTGNFTAPLIDDSLALWDIYTRSGANRMFVGPALERIAPFAKNLPDKLQGPVRSYVLEKMGYAGGIEQALDTAIPRINQKIGLNLPPDTSRQLTQIILTSQYSGLLSSPATWFRQTFQYPLFGYARLGPKFAVEATRKALTPAGLDEVRKAGFFVDLGVPYGEELTKDITIFGRGSNAYKNIAQAPIAPNSLADNVGRATVYHQLKMQFEDALARYNTGQIPFSSPSVPFYKPDFKATFESETGINNLSPVDQNIIRQKIVAGDIDGGFKHLAREVIDETNFPYRKAAGNRIGYGLAGKVSTSLLQWPTEAVHTLSRWAVTGQWDKVFRWYAASTAIQRTMQDTFGFDFTKSLFLGPFNQVLSPALQTAINTINAFTSAMQNNRQELNANADKIVKTAGAVTPAGVMRQNVQKFFAAYNRGNQMIKDGSVPDPAKPYPVLDTKGQIRYYTDFAGIFWGELMGFPIDKKVSDSALMQDIRNAQFSKSEAKDEVMKLLQEGKYDEAGSLMGTSGVTVSAADFKAYYIPLTERTYQQLPAILKAQFGDRIFPNTETGVQ